MGKPDPEQALLHKVREHFSKSKPALAEYVVRQIVDARQGEPSAQRGCGSCWMPWTKSAVVNRSRI